MIPASSTLLILLFSFYRQAFAQFPKQASWSSQPFGPDGPWNTVQVSIGGQPQIALFPGRMWSTVVTTSDYCAINNSIPHCASGTYLKDAAGSKTSPGFKIGYRDPVQGLIQGVEALGLTSIYVDSVDGGFFKAGAVMNHSLNVIDSQTQMLAYPGGTWYPIFTGCLSIGAPDRYQVFTGGDGDSPMVNASMIPWALKDQGRTTSSAFGLHYGSAVPSAKVPGSLLYGGYDPNRVVGDVLSYDGDLTKPVSVKDIGIRVVKGSSPFKTQNSLSNSNSTTITGLLAQGNSTITTAGLAVILDPCSPYLTLPKSTCDAVASYLPVNYNASLGLYIWDTSSPHYDPIVKSASALSFTIMGGSNTESATINIPFRHLNLTLSPPFTSAPVPYFPCFTGGNGTYVFGRAFFQDAYLGANWEKRKTWLAQAPGPNIPSRVDATNIQPDQDMILGGGNDWERSWEGFWTALTEEEANPTGKGGDNGDPGSTGDGGAGDGAGSSITALGGEKTGLSTAAIAGIAAGAAGVVIIVLGAGVFFWCRRGKGRHVDQEQSRTEDALAYGSTYADAKRPDWDGVPVEAPVMDNTVYEMPADNPGGQIGLR